MCSPQKDQTQTCSCYKLIDLLGKGNERFGSSCFQERMKTNLDYRYPCFHLKRRKWHICEKYSWNFF